MIPRYNRISLAFGAAGMFLLTLGHALVILLIPDDIHVVKVIVAVILLLAGVFLMHLAFVYYLKGKGYPPRLAWWGWLTEWILFFMPDKTIKPEEQVPAKVSPGRRWMLYLSFFSIFLPGLGIPLSATLICIALVLLYRERQTMNRQTRAVLLATILISALAIAFAIYIWTFWKVR